MKYTGERMIPDQADEQTFWEHVYRYRFACGHVRGKRVLDVACGEGYGTAALAMADARSVIGVDIDPATCEHVQRTYRLDARVGSAQALPVDSNSIDVVVSFETI